MIRWFHSLTDFLSTLLDSRVPKEGPVWGSLRLYLLYRVVLALALIFFFYSGNGPDFLGRHEPRLFALVAAFYGGLSLISVIFWHLGSPHSEQQAYLALFVDIVAITLMMHASGGVESGLGMLIAVSMAGGAQITGGRAALLFASLAALAVITDQLYSQFSGSLPTRFTQAGFLGAVFFATALLALVLSSRARESERLAQERKEKLNHLARLNEYVIQHMSTGVLAVDTDNNIVLMNDPAWRLLGMPEARTGNPLSAASTELEALLNQWRANHRCECRPFRVRPQGHEIKPHMRPLGFEGLGGVLLFLEDTSKIQREAQQMKLASLGRLTASIAHEIRNPLGAISHASQLFGESPDLNPADKRLTEIIKTNAIRVNRVIESVLQLSRKSPGQPVPMRLGEWTEEFAGELAKTQGLEPSRIHVQIDPHHTQVSADPEQLRQIVTNLCNNAREHCDNPANLRISLIGGEISEFGYPVLDVIDNGPGIPSKVAKKIFEPFYTTRNSGTGLGLYMAKELGEANQIRIEYIPNPTGGSCFRLHFLQSQMEVVES